MTNFVTLNPIASLKGIIGELKGLLGMTEDAKMLKAIGEDLVPRMKARVRLGYGVERSGAGRKKFKSLAQATIDSRTRMKEEGKLVSFSAPARSHLSMTGDMMNKLIYKVRRDRCTILFADSFANDKARWNSSARPFMFLTSSEVKAVRNIISEYIDQKVKINFK